MKSILIFFFLLFNLLIKGQDIIISGKLIDKQTSESLSYANIQVQGTNLGTVTNAEGYYSLKIPKKFQDKLISFNYLGYKLKTKTIDEIRKYPSIFLEQENISLTVVIIMPDSSLLDLLKRAYKRIPDNYPTEPTKLKGFYREILKTSANKYLYFAEGITETYKSSYYISSDNGQVKILKSLINEFPDADTLNKNVVFYGGIFSGNDDDFVKKREEFINPKYFKKYNYSLQGITTYQNQEVYIVNFDTRNDSLKGNEKGKLYIEKSSLAYIAFKVELTESGINKYNNKSLTPFMLKTANISINFIKYKNKWHIKYITEELTGVNKTFKSNLIYATEYLTTEIQTDSVKPIPFDERLEYTDVFSLKAADYYSDDYWSEYNVLNQDTILKNQIKPLYTTEQSKDLLTMKVIQPTGKMLLKVVSSISGCFGIGYLPIQAIHGEYSVLYTNQNKSIILIENLNSFNYNLCYNFNINYSLTKRWGIDYSVYKSFENKMHIKSYDIGLSYKFLLLKKTKPLILKTSLFYSYNNFYRNFSEISNSQGEFTFSDKKFDSEKLQFGIGQKIIVIKPKISFQYKIGKLLWLNAALGYYFNLNTTDQLILQEKSGFFLTRKSASLPLTDNSLNVRFNGETTTKSQLNFDNYSFDIGLMIKF